VDQEGKSIDGVIHEVDDQFYDLGFLEPEQLVIEGAITVGYRFEVIDKVHDDF
jgi:hypothetical protein